MDYKSKTIEKSLANLFDIQIYLEKKINIIFDTKCIKKWNSKVVEAKKKNTVKQLIISQIVNSKFFLICISIWFYDESLIT